MVVSSKKNRFMPRMVHIAPLRPAIMVNPTTNLTQGASHCRSKGYAIMRVVKYRDKLPVSIVSAPSVSVFKKEHQKLKLLDVAWLFSVISLPYFLRWKFRNKAYVVFTLKDWRKFRQKSLSISPIDWTLIFPFPYIFSINSYHLDMEPNTLFYLRGFFRTVVAYFYYHSLENHLTDPQNIRYIGALNKKQPKMKPFLIKQSVCW